MIEYSETLVEDLREAANVADLGPADLADIVTRRYLRRRRRRTWIAGSTAGAVVALAVVGLTMAVPEHAPGTPGPSASAIPPGQGPWHVPPDGADVPPIANAWPGAVVHLPAKTPDGGTVSPMADIDATHLLVESEPSFEATGSFYSYDIPAGTFRLITPVAQGGAQVLVNRWAVSAHWVVWDVDHADTPGYEVFKAPLSGGPEQLVATLPGQVTDTGTWFATDSAVYWSGNDPGVLRLPLSGGSPRPVPGFSDMYVIDETSPWAVYMPGVDNTQMGIDGIMQTGITRRLKNLVTGVQIDVSVPHGTTSLQCSAAFCVGTVASGGTPSTTEFIQRPDGTARETIDGRWISFDVRPVGDGGIVVVTPEPAGASDTSFGWVIFDPVTGPAGSVTFARDATGGYSVFGNSDLLGWSSKGGSLAIDEYFVIANAHS